MILCRVLRNATRAVPLKYLEQSLKMPLINCKIELEFSWVKHCEKAVYWNEYKIKCENKN